MKTDSRFPGQKNSVVNKVNLPDIQNVFLFIVAYYKVTPNVKSVKNDDEDEKKPCHPTLSHKSQQQYMLLAHWASNSLVRQNEVLSSFSFNFVFTCCL